MPFASVALDPSRRLQFGESVPYRVGVAPEEGGDPFRGGRIGLADRLSEGVVHSARKAGWCKTVCLGFFVRPRLQ